MKAKTTYELLTEKYQDDLLNNLKEYVKIPSVYDEETKDEQNPFGKEVSNALNFITELAKKDGFKATNYDNMVVEIIAGDETKKNVTIMAHADVVPAGKGWEHDPFEMVSKDGVVYGRGVADDKGPLLSAYYGLLALKENNMLDGYHVRFLVGGNEESGSLGMEHYFHTLNKKQPDLGFSPDSAYPLTYGEKGIVGLELRQHVKANGIYSIKGGVAHNAVIEECVVETIKDNGFIEFLKKNNINFSYEEKEDRFIVTFVGKAAHGSVPWLGDNAGLTALKCVGEYFNVILFHYVGGNLSDGRGKRVNCFAHNEEMGDNSLCVGFVNYENEELYISVNFRYINTFDTSRLLDNMRKGTMMFVKEVGQSPLLYYPKDSLLISTLMKSYQDETGDLESQPMTSGGGTYAKEANNVVAFGMEKQGWDSKMHAIGEQTEISNLVKSMAIYARAIYDLGQKLK